MAEKTRPHKQDFALIMPLDTRWADNDQYGHLNNAVYYQLFDTAINKFLISNGLLDFKLGGEIFVVAETGCNYFQEVAYPQQVFIGLNIAHLGNSSIRYEMGLFTDRSDSACAAGFFVHVNLNKQDKKPCAIDSQKKAVLERFMRPNLKA